MHGNGRTRAKLFYQIRRLVRADGKMTSDRDQKTVAAGEGFRRAGGRRTAQVSEMCDAQAVKVEDADLVGPAKCTFTIIVEGFVDFNDAGASTFRDYADAVHSRVVPVAVAAVDSVDCKGKWSQAGNGTRRIGIQNGTPSVALQKEAGMAEPCEDSIVHDTLLSAQGAGMILLHHHNTGT